MLRFKFFLTLTCLAFTFCLCDLRHAYSQTTVPRRVTNTGEEAINLNPSLSGDGLRIAFESTTDLAATGGSASFHAIFADITREPPTFSEMGATRAVAPAITQDGARIAFASKDDPLGTNKDGNSEIFLFDSQTLRQITNTTPRDPSLRINDGNFQPSITDDGRFIAFSSNRNLTGNNADENLELFIYDSANGSLSQLTDTNTEVGAIEAKISGDGSHIVFLRDSSSQTSTQRDLVLYDRSSNTARVVASNASSLAFTRGRAISDDGTRTVYAAQTAANSTQVFLYDSESNSTRQITSLGSRATDVPLHPTISGDGQRISFATRRSVTGGNSDGSVELYVYDIPTSQYTRVTNAPSAATAEVVSSLNDDGTLVAFNFPRVLSSPASSSEFSNNSEIYLAQVAPRIERIEVTPLSANIITGAQQQFTAHAFRSNGEELAGITFQWKSSTAKVATIDLDGLASAITAGATQITASANGVSSKPALLTVRERERVVARIEVTPSSSTVNVGGTQQFKARAFDGDGQEISGVSFIWATDDASVAVIDKNGLATTLNEGATRINASASSITGSATLEAVAPPVVINELLADPPDNLEGDANHDGVRSGTDDEFIEIVNSSNSSLDLSGWSIRTKTLTGTNETIRHRFAPDTFVPAGDAIVVFGGGAFASNNSLFGGAQVIKSSSGSLSLSNNGITIIVRDATGNFVTQISYGLPDDDLAGDSLNQSITRSPDIFGEFIKHTHAAGAGNRLFSPGVKVDGSFFVERERLLSSVTLSPASQSIILGQSTQFIAQAFDQFGRPLANTSFSFQTGDPNVADLERARNNSNMDNATLIVLGRNTGAAPISVSASNSAHNAVSQSVSLNVEPLPPIPNAGQVIINEALVSFSASSTQTRNDFLELYNASNHTLDISGLTISFRPAGSSNTPGAIQLPGEVGSRTTLIASHSYFLIVNGPETFGVTADFDASQFGFDLNNTTGGIKIELNNEKLDGLAYQGGTAPPSSTFINYGEGSIFTFTSGSTNDLIRSPNATDSNNNTSDFQRNGSTSSVTPKAANP